MRSQRLSHLSKINRSLLDIAERTLDALGEEPAWFFTDLSNDWINLSGALLDACTPEEQLASLVFADFHSLFKEIIWFQRLFLWGNYPYVYRNLRFVWELLFRAYYADTYASEHPGETDLPGPSVDDKNAWLGRREHRLKWDSVFKPVLRKLLAPADEASIDSHYHPLWQRLHKVVHPSAELRERLVGESSLAALDNFDEPWARETLRIATEIFDLLWLAVLARFPKCAPLLAASDAHLVCPRARAVVERVRPA